MKLLTRELRKTLPSLGEGDGTAYVKFFTPWSNWTWYVTEAGEGEEEDLLFGLVDGLEKEIGYFGLTELKSIKGVFGLKVERDLHFQPQKVYNKKPFEVLV